MFSSRSAPTRRGPNFDVAEGLLKPRSNRSSTTTTNNSNQNSLRRITQHPLPPSSSRSRSSKSTKRLFAHSAVHDFFYSDGVTTAMAAATAAMCVTATGLFVQQIMAEDGNSSGQRHVDESKRIEASADGSAPRIKDIDTRDSSAASFETTMKRTRSDSVTQKSLVANYDEVEIWCDDFLDSSRPTKRLKPSDKIIDPEFHRNLKIVLGEQHHIFAQFAEFDPTFIRISHCIPPDVLVPNPQVGDIVSDTSNLQKKQRDVLDLISQSRLVTRNNASRTDSALNKVDAYKLDFKKAVHQVCNFQHLDPGHHLANSQSAYFPLKTVHAHASATSGHGPATKVAGTDDTTLFDKLITSILPEKVIQKNIIDFLSAARQSAFSEMKCAVFVNVGTLIMIAMREGTWEDKFKFTDAQIEMHMISILGFVGMDIIEGGYRSIFRKSKNKFQNYQSLGKYILKALFRIVTLQLMQNVIYDSSWSKSWISTYNAELSIMANNPLFSEATANLTTELKDTIASSWDAMFTLFRNIVPMILAIVMFSERKGFKLLTLGLHCFMFSNHEASMRNSGTGLSLTHNPLYITQYATRNTLISNFMESKKREMGTIKGDTKAIQNMEDRNVMNIAFDILTITTGLVNPWSTPILYDAYDWAHAYHFIKSSAASDDAAEWIVNNETRNCMQILNSVRLPRSPFSFSDLMRNLDSIIRDKNINKLFLANRYIDQEKGDEFMLVAKELKPTITAFLLAYFARDLDRKMKDQAAADYIIVRSTKPTDMSKSKATMLNKIDTLYLEYLHRALGITQNRYDIIAKQSNHLHLYIPTQ
jgi:hypothetical protein